VRSGRLDLNQRPFGPQPNSVRGRASRGQLSGYWGKVLASAGLGFDFNLATKHWAAHHLHVERGLPPRVIAEQVGWELAGTLKVLKVYGHGDVGALEEIDRAFGSNATPLRGVEGRQR
jgi:hypothetical protein